MTSVLASDSRRIGNLQGHIYKYTSRDRKAGSNHGILSCDVYNTGSGGIYLSGGSKRKLISGNNYVENCKVHNYNRRNKFLRSGINIDGCGNRISHCGNPNRMNMGIYCDDSSTDVLIFGNVFYKMNTKHGMFFSNSGWDLKMKNNIVIEPISYTAEISAHYYTWAKGGVGATFGENGLLRRRLLENVNITESPYSERYPELVNYLSPFPLIQWGCI